MDKENMDKAVEPKKSDRVYVEDRLVKNMEVMEKKTPLQQDILDIRFDTGENLQLTRKKFDAVKSFKKSDATAARNKLTRVMAQQIYALCMEYGLKLSEVDPVITEVVESVDAATKTAGNLLWDVEFPENRTLIMVNDILMKEYGESKEETKTGTDTDAPSS